MVICLDTETTGLTPAWDEILTLSIVDAESGDAILEGTYRPTRVTSWPEAERVNGISPEAVADCPPISADAGRIRDVLTSADMVVAYNVSFDLPFIEASVGRLPDGMVVSDPMLDFSEHHGLHGELRGDRRWVRLVEAAEWADHVWTGRSHGSLADARAAAAVWRWLRDKGEATSCPWGEFAIV